MLAFAGNSILCRMALSTGAIDPAGFTSIRMLAGALTLLLIVRLTSGTASVRQHGSWISASMLFAYAICFSYAYVSLSTGTGALILFGFVQGTMIAMALWSGERPNLPAWTGWLMACAGLVWLLLPGIEAPSPGGAALMAAAGIAWGVYSVRGRGEPDALASTCANFAWSLPFVGVLVLLTIGDAIASVRGVLLAGLSGAITSGIGYVAWYAALKYLRSTQAALVQLTVPAIATMGGVVLLDEAVSARLLTASALTLGGISLALAKKTAPRAES